MKKRRRKRKTRFEDLVPGASVRVRGQSGVARVARADGDRARVVFTREAAKIELTLDRGDVAAGSVEVVL